MEYLKGQKKEHDKDGNISPILSNIMLNELDKELEKRGLQYVRYADDCVIFTKSKNSAERVMKNITKYIETKLRLKVNKEKSKVDRPWRIKYLGFSFYQAKGKIEINDIGTTIGSHTGPGTVALFLRGKERID